MKYPRASARSRAAARLLELGLLLVTPLIFYRGFPEQFTYVKLILTEGIVLVVAVSLVLGLVWRIVPYPEDFRLAAPLVLMTIAVLASCLASPLQRFSLVEAELFLCGPLWLMSLVTWGRGEARVRRLGVLVTLAGGVMAVIALLQWAGRDPLLFGGYHVEWGRMRAAMRLYSTFGNPNLVAGYLIGAVFLALVLAASSKTLTARILSAAAMLVIFAAILGTRSRGAWLGLATGLLVARRFWAHRPGGVTPEPASSPPSGTLACLLPAGLLILLPGLALQGSALISRLQGRVCLWRASWPMFTQHPFLGSGWGMFQVRFLELQAQFLASHPECVRYWTYARQLHNDPLQILLEAGAVGLVAFGWLLWTYGREVRGLLRQPSRPGRLWLAASAGGVTALLVDSLFNFQLSVPPTLILLFTLLAVPQMLKVPDSSPPASDATKSRVAFRSLLSVTVLGAALFLASGIVRRARAEHSFALGLELERRGQPTAAEQFFRAGLALAPDDGGMHYGLARTLYMQEQYAAALAEALRAERNFADSHLEVLKARIQDQMGFRVSALAAYRHALWLDPTLKSVPADIERLSK